MSETVRREIEDPVLSLARLPWKDAIRQRVALFARIIRGELPLDRPEYACLALAIWAHWNTDDLPRALLARGHTLDQLIGVLRHEQVRSALSEAERHRLGRLQITGARVHRGACVTDPHAFDGFSWSLDVDIARGFAERHIRHGGRSGLLITGRVAGSDILLFLDRHNEQELVVRPGAVAVHHIEELAK